MILYYIVRERGYSRMLELDYSYFLHHNGFLKFHPVRKYTSFCSVQQTVPHVEYRMCLKPRPQNTMST